MSDDTDQLRSELAKARADLDAAILSVAGGWMRTGNEHEIERAISVHVAAAVVVATADMRADLARIRAAVEPLDLYFRSKHELGAVVQMSVDPRETFAMRNVLAEVAAIAVTPCHCARTVDPNAVGFAEHDPPIGEHPTATEIVERVALHAGDSFDTLRIRGHRVVKAEQSAALDRHHASEATS